MRLLRNIPRNAALLFMLLFMIAAGPSLVFDESWFIGELIFDAVLIVGVYSLGPSARHWPFLLLTVATLGVRWGELLSGARGLDVSALVMTILWLGYAVTMIIGHLFSRRDVTLDTIFGAIVAYLLVAVGFSMVFQDIELASPDSFRGLPDNIPEDRAALVDTMMYFSLVCITTMGYGDIVPTSALARPLAVMEGVFGQLYLAVMIARLVGLHIVSERERSE